MARPPLIRLWAWALAAIVAAGTAGWLGSAALARRALVARLPVPPDVAARPPAVADAIHAAEAEARRVPSAATIGALGRAYHASQLATPALAAYALAESLADGDWRWTYSRALVLEERGAEGTKSALEAVVTRAPQLGPAWYRLGELHFKQGRLDEASAAYDRAAAAPAEAAYLPSGVAARQTTPLSVYARVGLARVAIERGHTDEAHAILQAVADSYPAFGQARTLLRGLDRPAPGGDPGRAASSAFVPPADPVVDAMVAASPDSDVLLKYAGLASRAGDVAWREFLVRRALAVNPDDLNVRMEAASAARTAGRLTEALDHLRRHEALAPGDHHALVEEGRVLADLGRLPEAESVLRRATGVRDAAAEYNLGTVLDGLGRPDEAVQHYQRALAIDPFHARAMNNLGVGYDRRGDSATAVGWFERAIAIAPESAEFYVNYGSALIQLRRFDDAVRVLTEAVGLDPRDANAHNNLGIAVASRGELPRARQSFAKALELNPAHANARRNLDRVLAALGR